MWRMYQFNIIVIILAGLSSSIYAGVEVGIYSDYGAWEDGIRALEQFLDWKGVSHERLTAEQINTQTLTDEYVSICFPGGYALYYKLAITASGIQNIRDLVSNGGSYIGFCAGAFFACDSVNWEEDGLFDYPLDLYQGIGYGAIDAIVPWDGHTMTTINLQPLHPINTFEPASEKMLYYGGPWFKSHQGVRADTVGTYEASYNFPAIISTGYGEGRVLLIGTHPEIEEDSDRDSVTFAQELDDAGSDWPFLWSAVDWLLGRPITYPLPSNLDMQFNKPNPGRYRLEQNYPNPFNEETVIPYFLGDQDLVKITLWNTQGQYLGTLLNQIQSAGEFRINYDAGHLPAGCYIYRMETGSGVCVTKKMLLIR